MKRLVGFILIGLGVVVLNVSAEEKKNPADANGDGKVSKQEYCDREAAKAKRDGKEYNQAEAEKKFAKKDKDGNGFLEGDELISKPKTPAAPAAPKSE
ncbi:MAG: hypothetical protein MUC65_04295 [Pontiellaceae bacterium]|nr:hypothetical protein [Pontiellaceae bacterium]